MFVPFQRLGDTDSTTGVGVGLVVARGLTEAMRGTLGPEQTPGGGLTMTIALPAAPRPAQAPPASPEDASGKGSDRPPQRTGSRRRSSIARYWSDSVRAADVGFARGTAKAGGYQVARIRRLGRETPHGNVA